MTDLVVIVKKLAHYCAYQERCRQEVVQKMVQLEVDKKLHHDVLTHLKETDLLNEERFAENYITSKIQIKRWGKHKIIQALLSKGIEQQHIEAGLQKMDNDTYLDNLKTLGRHYFKKQSATATNRKKCVQFLMRKGYEYDLIMTHIGDF